MATKLNTIAAKVLHLGKKFRATCNASMTVSQVCVRKTHNKHSWRQAHSSGKDECKNCDQVKLIPNSGGAHMCRSSRGSRSLAKHKCISQNLISHMCLERNLLVSASWDSTVKLWSCSQGNKGFQIDYKGEFDHESAVTCLSLHSDGARVATGTREGQVITWDAATTMPTLQLQGHSGTVTSVNFSQDGRRLMTCGEDQFLRVIDIATGTQVYSKDTGHNLKCAVWDGKTVMVGTGDGNLLLWDLVAVELVKQIRAHSGAVTCLNASQDGLLVTGGEDRIVKMWQPS